MSERADSVYRPQHIFVLNARATLRVSVISLSSDTVTSSRISFKSISHLSGVEIEKPAEAGFVAGLCRLTEFL
ncbi:hypothetical protein [Achromobacter xylosoxidans]|uniref:hypothetical protein n=1 Tax=Alcaligenes xylosoxydans xylosoxydans TaxID=85698 RepID=UPI001F139787|nr:hypothetical protein [Achromobacter xylosoxidans]